MLRLPPFRRYRLLVVPGRFAAVLALGEPDADLAETGGLGAEQAPALAELRGLIETVPPLPVLLVRSDPEAGGPRVGDAYHHLVVLGERVQTPTGVVELHLLRQIRTLEPRHAELCRDGSHADVEQGDPGGLVVTALDRRVVLHVRVFAVVRAVVVADVVVAVAGAVGHTLTVVADLVRVAVGVAPAVAVVAALVAVVVVVVAVRAPDAGVGGRRRQLVAAAEGDQKTEHHDEAELHGSSSAGFSRGCS